jgi:hypothetical protein
LLTAVCDTESAGVEVPNGSTLSFLAAEQNREPSLKGDSMRRLFPLLRPRSFALACINIYVSAAALTVVVAHILLIAMPKSGLGERVVLPLTKGLEFLDVHWKSVLLVVFPFVAPLVPDLIRRLRKVGSVEFDPVQLEDVGVHEKPTKAEFGVTP